MAGAARGFFLAYLNRTCGNPVWVKALLKHGTKYLAPLLLTLLEARAANPISRGGRVLWRHVDAEYDSWLASSGFVASFTSSHAVALGRPLASESHALAACHCMHTRKTCASVAFCFTTTFKPYCSSIFGTTLVALSSLQTHAWSLFHMLPHLLLSSVHSHICALVCILSYLCSHLCAPSFLPRDAMFHLFLFTLFGVPCRCNL